MEAITMIDLRLGAEWDRLVAKMIAAEAALPYGLDEDHPLVVAVDAIRSELDDCAREIIRQRATNDSDVRLLAEVCYWAQWSEVPLDGFKAEGDPGSGTMGPGRRGSRRTPQGHPQRAIRHCDARAS
jgi:hypothetical protein